MRKFLIVFALIIPFDGFTQNINKDLNAKNSDLEIFEMEITNARKIKFICGDSIEILRNKYFSKKYIVKCKESIPTKFTNSGQGGYVTGAFFYEVYLVNDSCSIIRDSLMGSIQKYLNKPVGLIRQNIYIKGNEILLVIDSGTNDYGDYLLYWYHNNIYKIVLIKSRFLFWTNIGGLYDIDLQFKTNDDKDFFPYDYEGLKAFEYLSKMQN